MAPTPGYSAHPVEFSSRTPGEFHIYGMEPIKQSYMAGIN